MWQVIGHQRAVNFLQRSLEGGRLSHAYLLTGPSHVGKMTLALQLAQAVNCQNPLDRPCGACPACRRIAEGKHADVEVMRVAPASGRVSEIGIDAVREAQHHLNLKAYEGLHRVLIVEGAEALSGEASNALLKTLEEPPPNVLIILLANSLEALLPTVASRCFVMELRPLPLAQVAAALQALGAPQAQALELAQRARGCLGWALDVWRNPEVGARREERLDRLASLADSGLMERLSFSGDTASAFFRDRQEVAQTLELWAQWWRDVLLVKEGCEEYVGNPQRVAHLRGVATRSSSMDVVAFLRRLGEAMDALKSNVNPLLVLDDLVLSLPGAC